MVHSVSYPAKESDLPGIGEALRFEGHIKKRQPGIWHFHRVPFPKGVNNITSAGWALVGAKSAVVKLGVSTEKYAAIVEDLKVIRSEDGGENLPIDIDFEGKVYGYMDFDEYFRFLCGHRL